DGARTALNRIDECLGKLRELAGKETAAPDSKLIEDFTAALDHDLNIAGAWGCVFEWVSEINRQLAKNALTPTQAAAALAAWDRINTVLGISAPAGGEAPAELLALLEERQAARKAKDFKRSDAIRDELKAKGWVVEDSPKGPKLKKI
ncbi:MAG TPA: DALR domain-containing protein, partial [Candidatus Paceibacterota bacterium]|nr:DALR domain-containing protein [Candidatus Paceibacterota bacterium]